jgi:hypothetical protein
VAVEWLCLASLRRVEGYREASSWIRVWPSLPRIYGIGSALILLSGIYLVARVGVYDFAWVRVPFVALILMAIIGGPVIRSRTRDIFEAASGDRSRDGDGVAAIRSGTRCSALRFGSASVLVWPPFT